METIAGLWTWALGAAPVAAALWAGRRRLVVAAAAARARYRSTRSAIARIDKLEEEIASLTRINAICIAERDLMYQTARRLTEEGELVEMAHERGLLSTSDRSPSGPAGSPTGSPPSRPKRGSGMATRSASRRTSGHRSRGRRLG